MLLDRVLSIYYATLDLEKGELSDPEEITEVLLSGRLKLEDVTLGLSQDMGYVLWSDYAVGFDRYRFWYVTFPLNDSKGKQIDSWQLKVGDSPT